VITLCYMSFANSKRPFIK